MQYIAFWLFFTVVMFAASYFITGGDFSAEALKEILWGMYEFLTD